MNPLLFINSSLQNEAWSNALMKELYPALFIVALLLIIRAINTYNNRVRIVRGNFSEEG